MIASEEWELPKASIPALERSLSSLGGQSFWLTIDWAILRESLLFWSIKSEFCDGGRTVADDVSVIIFSAFRSVDRREGFIFGCVVGSDD